MMTDTRPGDGAVGEDSTEQATRASGGPPSWRPFVTPERLREIGSTNAELVALAHAGAPEGTVLLAESQSAGSGRLGRRWLDHPGGSVLCSMLFRPAWAIESWFLASFVVALSAIEACREVAKVDCACKWPNDLIAGGEQRKVAGVLAETALPGALVVGIGINCNWPDDFPPPEAEEAAEVAARAISLNRLAGQRVDRDEVATRLLEAVARRWKELSPAEARPSPGARQALRREYRQHCATIGELVRIDLPNEELTGRAIDIDERGRLLVEAGAGVRIIDTGDVIHLRPGDPSAPD